MLVILTLSSLKTWTQLLDHSTHQLESPCHNSLDALARFLCIHEVLCANYASTDIDSLLDTLKSLSYNEDVEDLKILEDMLKSNTFKKAKQVGGVKLAAGCGLAYAVPVDRTILMKWLGELGGYI